jgi:hypothetical protein
MVVQNLGQGGCLAKPLVQFGRSTLPPMREPVPTILPHLEVKLPVGHGFKNMQANISVLGCQS